jgi:hypothetical protein
MVYLHKYSAALTWLIIIVGSGLALYMNLKWMPGVLVDNAYLPLSHDSFYHARRILDAIADPGRFYQFDPLIHAPEGSWLTWPWAYDRMMAWLARAGMSLFGIIDPMKVLVLIPPLASVISVALIAGICRKLNFTLPLLALAVACFALLPLTQSLHGVGILDHHYVELIFVLLTLYLGLLWLSVDINKGYAALLGLALGAAPAFHNGLFVLQVPVLACLAILWLRGSRRIRETDMAVFAMFLLGSTLVFLLPSEPFQRGWSSYFLHSWFHMYLAFCTSFAVLYMARFRCSLHAFLLLLATGLVLLLVIKQQIAGGLDFVSSDMPGYGELVETKSLKMQAMEYGIQSINSKYTLLIWLLPFVFVLHCYRLVARRRPEEVFFSVMVVFGALLLVMQQRLQYFGSFALYLPLLQEINMRMTDSGKLRQYVLVGTVVVLCVAFIPSVGMLRNSPMIGRTPEYALTRGVYPSMRQVCDQHPGVVLADRNDGHYIRFHSECLVIANNMILTPQHVKKTRQLEKMLARSAADIRANEPWVDYVYVNRMDNIFANEPLEKILEMNSGLRRELLLNGDTLPEGYTLLAEVMFNNKNPNTDGVMPLARFFRIER